MKGEMCDSQGEFQEQVITAAKKPTKVSQSISTADAREFFEQYVRPSYDDWMKNPLDIRLAKECCIGGKQHGRAHAFKKWVWQAISIS